MELKYGNPNGLTPNGIDEIPREKQRITFFRNHRSSLDIIEESKQFKGRIKDDSINDPTLFDGESCDIYSSCAD